VDSTIPQKDVPCVRSQRITCVVGCMKVILGDKAWVVRRISFHCLIQKHFPWKQLDHKD